MVIHFWIFGLITPHVAGSDPAPAITLVAARPISGIELVHKIKKGQFDTTSLALSKERAPQVWEAVMAA